MKNLEWKKIRNLSFLVAAARESASHQPLLDLMSSNGRLKLGRSFWQQLRGGFKFNSFMTRRAPAVGFERRL